MVAFSALWQWIYEIKSIGKLSLVASFKGCTIYKLS